PILETCVRRLASGGRQPPVPSTEQGAHAPRSHRKLDVIRDASVEVRKPTLFGELIILIVYVPILTLEGVEGKLFRPMALTVIFALLGSLALSMTLMPVLASLFLPLRPKHAEVLPVRAARWALMPVLSGCLRFPWAVVGIAIAAVAAAAM